MTDAPTPPVPGEMTVPPLFGWEAVAAVVLLVLAVAVLAAVAAAAAGRRGGRREWEAWLAGRSRLPGAGEPRGAERAD